MNPRALADQFNTREMLRRCIPQTPVLGGGEANFAFVLQPHAHPSILDPYPCGLRQIKCRGFHAIASNTFSPSASVSSDAA